MSLHSLVPFRRNLFTLLAIALALGFLFVSRFPYIAHSYQLDPDESHMMALSIRLDDDWMPWRSINAGTSGPFTPGIIALAAKLGIPRTYAGGHMLALGLFLAVFMVGWRVCRRLTDETSALVAFLACILWLASSQSFAFLHLASELVPVLFIGIALLFLVETGGACTVSPWRLAAGSFFTGLAPLAKMQVAPLSLCVCAWLAISLLWFDSGRALVLRSRLQLVLLSALASFIPLLLMVGLCFKGGTLSDFWTSYVKVNFAYAGQKDRHVLFRHALNLLKYPWNQGLLALLFFVGFLRPSAVWDQSIRPGLFLFCGLLLASLYAVLFPQTDWGHYSILMFIPIQLGVALCLHSAGTYLRTASEAPNHRLVIALGAATLGLPFVVQSASDYQRFRDMAAKPGLYSTYQATLKERVTPVIKPGSSVFVWGFAACVYVDLKAKPAARNVDFLFLVKDFPQRQFLRERLMQDLDASKPEWILVPRVESWLGLSDEACRPFVGLQAFMDKSYVQYSRDEMVVIYRRVKE